MDSHVNVYYLNILNFEILFKLNKDKIDVKTRYQYSENNVSIHKTFVKRNGNF